MELSDSQLQTLRHMLGIDKPWDREPNPYRNYYCANPANEKLLSLAVTGHVELYSTSGGYEWWRCTDSGRAAAIASHRKIREPKRKRVYRAFLHCSECFPDLTFREYLTLSAFDESRREA